MIKISINAIREERRKDMDIKGSTKKMRETAQEVMGKLKTIEKVRIDVKTEKREVNFVFHKSEAKKVYLSGDFNNWNTQSHPMKMSGNGRWTRTMKLPPGLYEYGFFVDGSWAHDLPCSEMVTNPFGTHNCIMRVE